MVLTHFITELDALHRESILQWKKNTVQLTQLDFFKLAEENHAFNYQLWHAEDMARRDDMGFEFVYRAKRNIDHFNQQRNNRMEMMDTWLQQQLQPAASTTCPVHSETPGMMIDRLSILALKQYHMALQCERTDVDNAHRLNCQNKLDVIQLQQRQLLQCLNELLHEVTNKQRTFIVYHQFKMYNDPTLNPELYCPSTPDHPNKEA
jgi:hypothetical protein